MAFAPAASLALSAAGAVSGAVGSYYSAKSQKSQLDFQAGIDDTNARLSELSAQSALLQGQRQEQGVMMRTGQIVSAQRVAQAANGVSLGEGNAAEVTASAKIMGAIDAQTVNNNAVNAAWGYRTQATNYQNDALIKRATAGAISPEGLAATSLLTSAGKVASQWYSMDKVGAFDNNDKGGFSPLTALTYGTNTFSQQSKMLSEQDSGLRW